MIALAILDTLVVAAAILILRRGSAALAVTGSGLALIAAIFVFVQVAGGVHYEATLPGLPGFPLRLVADPLNATLSVVVAFVVFCVMVYAVGYMRHEEGQVRFFAGMSFFAAAMQALVLAGDWVLLLASWELIGLSSYLLIGFWHEREGVVPAATRAFLYTRTADLGLYVAVFILITQTGTSEIAQTFQTGGAAAVVAGLFLLLAAAGKSAQTPLSGWLQDAMKGPTPVSALLHSATLVAAGTILLIRVSPVLPESVLLVVGALGGVTTLVAGITALAQSDLKRLLASSTSAQYGLMLIAVGAGAPVAATIYLAAHAAIKSSLFLGAGVFQRARKSTLFEDLGGAGRDHRLAFYGFFIAGLALAGAPPLAGFFSKDAILGATLGSQHAYLFTTLALAGTLLTGAYVAQALLPLWRGEGRSKPVARMDWMSAGLAALVAPIVFLGPALIPLGGFLGGGLSPNLVAAALGLLVGAAGFAVGWFIPAKRLFGPLLGVAERGFRVESGFDGLVVRPALAAARAADAFDRTIHAGVLGVGRLGLAAAGASRFLDERGIDSVIAALVRGTTGLGGRARELQSGLVHRELALAVIGGAVVLAFAFAAGIVAL